jgi:hypothetical protein
MVSRHCMKCSISAASGTARASAGQWRKRAPSRRSVPVLPEMQKFLEYPSNPLNPHLDELALIEHFDILLMIKVAHVFDQLFHADIVRVDQTEGRDIYKIILKVLHVEGFNVERCEKVVVLVFVHL